MSVGTQLERIACALSIPASIAERRFLAIGQSLEQAVDVLGHLVALCQELLTNLQSSEIIQARQTLAAAAAHIEQFASMQYGVGVALGRLADIIAAVEGHIAQMRDIGREVDVLAMNASLAAAAMGVSGADFLVFAGEIRRAATKAQINLSQIGSELSLAGQHLSAARSSVNNFAKNNAVALQAIPRHLAGNVAELERRAGLAGDAALLVAARAQDVAAHVSSAIMALQLGDITRQRIEHVQAALGTLRQLPTTTDENPFSGLSEAVQEALVAAGCRLVGDQLLDTAAELDEAAEQVDQRLAGLAGDAQEIGRLGDQAHAAAGAANQTFLTGLHADVRRTQDLFDSLRTAYEDADARTASVLETANRLVGHMATIRAVEADIHIMGLNTTLKCGRLGSAGRALGVIAQELRRCGNDTAAQAEAVATELGQLVSLAGAVADSRQVHDNATTDTVAQEMVIALGRLESTGLSEALATLQRDGVSVAELLGSTATDFVVRHEIGEVLRRSAAEIASIAEQRNDCGADAAEPKGRLLALVSRAYTMPRERKIHARHGELANNMAADAPSSTDDIALADMLF